MLQTSARFSLVLRHITGVSPASLRAALGPKSVAVLGAACAYVGVGFVAFQVACAITGDRDFANWIVVGLSVPLAAPLVYAIDWIEKHL